MEKLNELPQAFYGVIQDGKVVMLPADDGQWLNKTTVVEAFRALERTADVNMAAAQAMRDDMYHWKQRAEAAEAKAKNLNDGWLNAIAERDEDRTEQGKLEAARSVRDNWKERSWAAEEKLAELEKQANDQKPFMYGIMTANGDAHFEDFCVSSDPGLLEDVIWEWNNGLADNEPKSQVVALYTHPTLK